MSHSPLLIQSVSDTALAVAYARALESDRPDALFKDPFARSLAGEQGKVIYQKIQGDRSIGWLVTARTIVLDNLILQSIQQDGVDTVLNLAAGLDTRPYRMALPAQLRWIEVDLPPILTYKQKKLADAQPNCKLEQIPVDLTDEQKRRDLFSDINHEASKVMIITEGLLVYLSPEQVSSLATNLYAQPSFSTWLSDLVSPLSVKIAQLRMSKEQVAEDVQFQFAPKNANRFFEPLGWRVKEERSLWHEAHRLKREVSFGKVARWLPFLRVSTVFLDRKTPFPPAF
jgi:methyltransferase (TIGR00027 family)